MPSVPHSLFHCSYCGNQYDHQKFKPCKGLCSHSICLQCHNALSTRKCKICDREDSFSELRIDYSSIEMLQKLQEFLEANRTNIHYCSECEDASPYEKLRICTHCHNSNFLPLQNPHSSSTKVPIARKLSYVFKGIERESAKKLAICTSCAFERHSDHMNEVVKFEDVKELSELSRSTKRRSDDMIEKFSSVDKRTKTAAELECYEPMDFH